MREILAGSGLVEDDLENTPTLPLDPDAMHDAVRHGVGPAAVLQNCSGKHAGMLATAVINGWPTAGYTSPDHPVQRLIVESLDHATGSVAHVGVDGCGAPAPVVSLVGLARAVRALAVDGHPVHRAMSGYPEMVGGPTRDVTRLMRLVPGLIAKDGAEGVYVAALPDGRAVALKVADGAGRARAPVMVAALRVARCRPGSQRRRRGRARARRTGRPGAARWSVRREGTSRRASEPGRRWRRHRRGGDSSLVPHGLALLRGVARLEGAPMSGPDFQPLGDIEYGRVDRVAPMLRRVIAENPSKFTYKGTGTYIVGEGEVAVVDPGPMLDSHRDALAAALAGERVAAICVTHCHSDHSPLAAWLREETGAPTYAFGPHPPVDPDDEEELDEEIGEGVKIEETTDFAFEPDVRVGDGEVAATGPGWTISGVHTPGHTSNHMCFAFAEQAVLFPGDHVMGWSTTVVSPPDGDMTAYIDSLRKVAGRSGDRTYWPTHGPSIEQPQRYVDALVEHRLQRERQVLDAVASGLTEIPAIVALLYADVDEKLHKPAGRSVLSHLVKLTDEGTVRVTDGPRPRLTSHFTAT